MSESHDEREAWTRAFRVAGAALAEVGYANRSGAINLGAPTRGDVAVLRTVPCDVMIRAIKIGADSAGVLLDNPQPWLCEQAATCNCILSGPDGWIA